MTGLTVTVRVVCSIWYCNPVLTIQHHTLKERLIKTCTAGKLTTPIRCRCTGVGVDAPVLSLCVIVTATHPEESQLQHGILFDTMLIEQCLSL